MRPLRKSKRAVRKKKPNDLEESSTPNLVPQGGAQSFQPHILNMQKLVGNRAVLQMMSEAGNNETPVKSPSLSPLIDIPTKTNESLTIQRMPTKSDVLDNLGAPKKHQRNRKGKIKKENSTKYRAVLEAMETFEGYTHANFLAQTPEDIRTQMIRVNQLLQKIYDTMSAYKPKGKKGKYMASKLAEVKEFQNTVARAFLEKIDKPDVQNALLGQSLTSFFISAQRDAGGAPLELDEDDQIGSERGGSKEVLQFEEGYFKENQNTISDLKPGEEEWYTHVAELNTAIDAEGLEKGWDDEKISDEKYLRKNAMRNEYDLGVDELGINPDDARMSNRDVAMSRLDQLFDTKLIARTQFATLNMEDGSKVEGTIMENAGGEGSTAPNEVLEEGLDKGFDNKDELVEHRHAKLGTGDPELMRQLSRLYLIDLIANQIDRNKGNYFIKRDTEGNLLAITGIDNDFAFGTGETADINTQELNGISRYVDKEMAEMIMSLDASILDPVLSDLLPEVEVQAAIKRLEDLQRLLAEDETNLLEPDEWLEHKDAILDEGKDYYSSLMQDIQRAHSARYKT